MHAFFNSVGFELAEKSVNPLIFSKTFLANYKLAELISGKATIDSSIKKYIFSNVCTDLGQLQWYHITGKFSNTVQPQL
jgi:hypothetical protein